MSHKHGKPYRLRFPFIWHDQPEMKEYHDQGGDAAHSIKLRFTTHVFLHIDGFGHKKRDITSDFHEYYLWNRCGQMS
ncbi:hypothetical protein [Novacetimonas cocois]|uniref:hypothetical protein n=1 Tax=Novacetimonas cocois TaxID=1747507 RepID=UPI001EF0DC77|nr:hypothetical protein [Novacetimonas cocois]